MTSATLFSLNLINLSYALLPAGLLFLPEKCRPPAEQLLHRGTAFLQIQIVLHQSLQHLVPIQLADQRAGAVVVGDVGGIL